MAKTVFEKAVLQKDINALLSLSLEQLSQSINGLLWRQAQELGLSPLQVRILLLIRHETDVAAASHLAQRLSVSKATVSVALKPLMEKKTSFKKKIRGRRAGMGTEIDGTGRTYRPYRGILFRTFIPVDRPY